MLNQVVLVGRLTEEIKPIKLKDKDAATMTLSVSRTYKNDKGEYDIDYIECTLFGGVVDATKEYCHTGDILGVKGSLEYIDNKLTVIASKVTFLSSKHEKDE